MMRELLDHMTFVYGFICKGRGRIEEDAMLQISDGTKAMVENAPVVIGKESPTVEETRDYDTCKKIMENIDEIIVYFHNTEII